MEKPRMEVSGLLVVVLLLPVIPFSLQAEIVSDIITGDEFLITASPQKQWDNFGSSVAISGDTVIVGSPGWRWGYDTAGAFQIFERTTSPNGWVQQLQVSWNEGYDPELYPFGMRADGDQMGASVDVGGGIAVVGVPGYEPTIVYSKKNVGAVFVYRKDAQQGWVDQPFVLMAPDQRQDDSFGTSVALSGTRLIVGAVNAQSEIDPSVRPGAAYIFEMDAESMWTEVVRLNPPDQSSRHEFGCSVAIDGDIAVVGARNLTSGGLSRAGAVYIYRRSTTGSWQFESEQRGHSSYGKLGSTVGVSGETVVAGAPNASNWEGRAFIYLPDAGGTWTEHQELVKSDPDRGDYFGQAVSVSDGVIIVGSHTPLEGVDDAGAAHLFQPKAGSWSETGTLLLSGQAFLLDDHFGWAVAVDGGRAVVGAPNDDFPEDEWASRRLDYGSATIFEMDLSAGPPANQAPVALCQDVTVTADSESCRATADINNGSHDPDGDALTFSQDPTSFDIGLSSAELTVSDGDLSDQCTAIVTVEDLDPPTFTFTDPGLITVVGNFCGGVAPDVSTSISDVSDCSVPASVTQSPSAGEPLTFGTQPITLSVSDSKGNTDSSSTVTVSVLTPGEALEQLVGTIQASSLPKGAANSLAAKLEAALRSLEKGRLNAALNQLKAFQNEIAALVGKKIDPTLAESLLSSIEVIVQAMSEDCWL